jgi:hypothetical protein
MYRILTKILGIIITPSFLVERKGSILGFLNLIVDEKNNEAEIH